eukprot:2197882-Karenia_brevis.AAC.1
MGQAATNGRNGAKRLKSQSKQDCNCVAILTPVCNGLKGLATLKFCTLTLTAPGQRLVSCAPDEVQVV